MTVSDLIRELEKCPPDAEVRVGAVISSHPVWSLDVDEDDGTVTLS